MLMKHIKWLCIVIAAALMLTLSAPLKASAITFTPTNGKDEKQNPVPIEFYSKSIYMIDLDTGDALVDINSDEKRSPGYLTQLMTCAIILDTFNGNEKKLRETKVYADNGAYDELYDTGAPTADIRPYETVSYYDLLVAMILCSSCEAANIAAINLSKSIFEFTIVMNEKAKKLGMENTNFSSAHGFFTAQNYSTAEDMAKLCRYIVNTYPIFKDISSQEYIQLEATDYHTNGTNIYNNNYMVTSHSNYYYAKADGMKSSTQESSGRCLATFARSDGSNYLIVSLDAPVEKTAADIRKGQLDPQSIFADEYVYYSMLDHRALYNWAFNTISPTDFINPNSEVTDAKVEYGKDADYVNLKPASGCTLPWPSDLSQDSITKRVTVFDNIVAPIEKNDILGYMELEYNGETIARVDLIATSSVSRSDVSSSFKIAGAYFSSSEFKWALFIIIMIFAVYAIGFFIYMQLKYLKIRKKK